MEIIGSLYVKCIAKLILHPLTYELFKHYNHDKIVQTAGTSISAVIGTKQPSKFYGYATAFTWVESPINIVGVAVDIVQTIFECCGHPKIGKLLGFSVSVFSGAVGGARLAGVHGAILGAIISGAVWLVGELARYTYRSCECDQN